MQLIFLLVATLNRIIGFVRESICLVGRFSARVLVWLIWICV
jgi:cobalamin biosynthesis protein CobD/CbiB